MIKSTRPTPGNADLVTVYGKVPRQMAERLDELAAQRRWSRAQMVAYCIEKFLENGNDAEDTSRGAR